MVRLRGGFETADPRLDRLPEFDDRSRAFAAVEAIAPDASPKTRVWLLRWLLDQLQEGACTNFALAHTRLAQPRPWKLAATVQEVEALARERYRRSKQLDPWPGEDYEGTSQLAACKAWREAGLLHEYRWGFGIDDVIVSLGHLAPGVMATDWRDSMFETGPGGLLDISGSSAGGHAYAVMGVVLSPQRSSRWRATGEREPILVGPNSWGEHRSPREPARGASWGLDGWWAMRVADAETLLKADGEYVVPLDRA